MTCVSVFDRVGCLKLLLTHGPVATILSAAWPFLSYGIITGGDRDSRWVVAVLGIPIVAVICVGWLVHLYYILRGAMDPSRCALYVTNGRLVYLAPWVLSRPIPERPFPLIDPCARFGYDRLVTVGPNASFPENVLALKGYDLQEGIKALRNPDP